MFWNVSSTEDDKQKPVPFVLDKCWQIILIEELNSLENRIYTYLKERNMQKIQVFKYAYMRTCARPLRDIETPRCPEYNQELK